MSELNGEDGTLINVFSGCDSFHSTGYQGVYVVVFRRPHMAVPDVNFELTIGEAKELTRKLETVLSKIPSGDNLDE